MAQVTITQPTHRVKDAMRPVQFGLAYDLRVVLACARKDIQSTLTERAFLIIATLLPLNFLLLFLLFVLTGGQAPTAVVLDDNGPLAQQFVTAMKNAHSFTLNPPEPTTLEHAQEMIQAGQIVAIVRIPATFDADLQAGRHIDLPVTINNLNVDFTNDIRRAVPLTISSFYAQAFPTRVTVQANEVDVHAQDTDYVPYLAVSIVVISLMVGGLLLGGSSAAREYEKETIKELLLSPASRWAISAGKLLATLILTLGSALIVLAVIIVGLGIHPINPVEVGIFTLVLLILFGSLGTLVGTLTKSRSVVVPLSLGLALPLFFLSGPFGPISFGSPLVALIARILPLSYTIALFQHAFHGFDTLNTPIGVNALVVLVFTVVAVILTTLAVRRRSIAH